MLALALLAGTVARLWLALVDDGVYWPDEVYQSLEPAHRMAFGYGLVAWEFVAGARSLALPGLIAAALAAGSWLGLDTPARYVPFIRCAFALASAVTALGVYRLARACGARRPAATGGAASFALMGLAIYFAPRAMSEVAAALPVTFGLALSLRPDPKRWKLLLGASLLGAAVLLRLHAAVFCVGLIGVLLARKQPRRAAQAGAVLAVWALVYGLVDLAGWGHLYHSAGVYLRFNLVENRAALWGTAPPAYYTRYLLASLGGLWVSLGLLTLLALRRAPALVLVAGLFLGLHMLSPHKELRFLVPLLPLLCAAAALGIEEVWSWRPFAGAAALGMLLAWSAYSFATFRRLTFRQVGREEFHQVSAFDHGGPESRLLIAAGVRPDLCGLTVLSTDRGNIGAYFYLHRDVPLYHRGPPLPARGHYNYAIAMAGEVPGEVVAEDSGRVLVRLSLEGCTPDPGFNCFLDADGPLLAAEPCIAHRFPAPKPQ
ncbi:MAG: glycosyltransferase family protein [Myxococcaceae bacterium]